MSVTEKVNSVVIMSERLESLKRLLNDFTDKRNVIKYEIDNLQKDVNDYNIKISDIMDEIYIIKQNWDVIIKSSDPIFKARVMLKRFTTKCPICGEPIHSKKDLKVHKFTKHGY